MAETTAAEVRDLADEELVTRLGEAKEELFNLASRSPPASSTTTGGSSTCGATSPASTR
jgi:hypothetical protein